MAVTRYSQNVPGQLVRSARFNVTADNDVLFTAGGDVLIVGVIFHSVATALNIDAGADLSAYPTALAAGEDLCVTTGGAGSVTVFFVEGPVDTYTTQNT